VGTAGSSDVWKKQGFYYQLFDLACVKFATCLTTAEVPTPLVFPNPSIVLQSQAARLLQWFRCAALYPYPYAYSHNLHCYVSVGML
jgi:hypothetical protein